MSGSPCQRAVGMRGLAQLRSCLHENGRILTLFSTTMLVQMGWVARMNKKMGPDAMPLERLSHEVVSTRVPPKAAPSLGAAQALLVRLPVKLTLLRLADGKRAGLLLRGISPGLIQAPSGKREGVAVGHTASDKFGCLRLICSGYRVFDSESEFVTM